VDSYVINQGDYLKSIPELYEPEHDGRYFWIFRNVDYLCWYNPELYGDHHKGIKTLFLSGSFMVRNAAAHLVRNLRSTGLLLHYFYGSRLPLQSSLRPNAQDYLFLICTLLKQLIENDISLGQSILRPFFDKLLKSSSKQELEKLSRDPMDFLEALSFSVLCRALEHALSSALKTREYVDSITFIFDIYEHPLEDAKVLIDSFRTVIDCIRHNHRNLKTRLMVTYKSYGGDLGLRQPSEVLITYDEERQGPYTFQLTHIRCTVHSMTNNMTACLRTLQLHNLRYQQVSIHQNRTCRWLQKSKQYQIWSSSKESNLLLIEGKPGSGKSTLLRYFNDHLLRLEDGDIVAKFFYTDRNGELERNHNSMLKSVLHDILRADESFFIHFQQAYRKLYDPESTQPSGNWPRKDLEKILCACIEKHPLTRKRKLFLIVDALDESDNDDRRAVVELLWSLSDPAISNDNCVAKILLATRPINELDQDLILRCGKILLQQHNQEDINIYTQQLLREPQFNRIQAFKTRIMEYITMHADGVFMWVHLVGIELKRWVNAAKSPNAIFDRLKLLPTNLEDFYQRMLHACAIHGDNDDIYDGIRILQFCLFSHRAVRLIEIHHALALPEAPDPNRWELDQSSDPATRLIHCTRNFVEIKFNITSNGTGTGLLFNLTCMFP
jgi:energy-coupling factor transporter ATP-binding protein EcfA2